MHALHSEIGINVTRELHKTVIKGELSALLEHYLDLLDFSKSGEDLPQVVFLDVSGEMLHVERLIHFRSAAPTPNPAAGRGSAPTTPVGYRMVKTCHSHLLLELLELYRRRGLLLREGERL